jgi:hypothetical protein
MLGFGYDIPIPLLVFAYQQNNNHIKQQSDFKS